MLVVSLECQPWWAFVVLIFSDFVDSRRLTEYGKGEEIHRPHKRFRGTQSNLFNVFIISWSILCPAIDIYDWSSFVGENPDRDNQILPILKPRKLFALPQTRNASLAVLPDRQAQMGGNTHGIDKIVAKAKGLRLSDGAATSQTDSLT